MADVRGGFEQAVDEVLDAAGRIVNFIAAEGPSSVPEFRRRTAVELAVRLYQKVGRRTGNHLIAPSRPPEGADTPRCLPPDGEGSDAD